MKYVIIGNSAAGIGAAEGIRLIDKTGEITIISNEPHHTYSRPLISYLLLGKTSEEKMHYRGENFYKENCVKFVNAEVTSIDAKGKKVKIRDQGSGIRDQETKSEGKDQSIVYDKLLVATGSSPFVPPFEGLDTVNNKFTFMSLDDALKLDKALGQKDNSSNNNSTSCKRVLIIGAGLIGLKCAEGIINKVADITVIDLAPRILSSILDDEGSKMVQAHIETAVANSGKNMNFKLGCSVKRFEKNTAYLDNGDIINFDVLVLAVGVRPNTVLLKDIANIDRGIIVDNNCRTSVQDIYAAGDCTQSLDVSSGQTKVMALLPNAYMQGECAGINMAGGEKSLDNLIPMNAIGFFGLHMITAGNYVGEVFVEQVSGVRCQGSGFVISNQSEKQQDAPSNKNPVPSPQSPVPTYKKLFYSGNHLNGFIMIGDVEKAGIYTSLIRERTVLDSIDFELICKKPGLMAFTKEARINKLGGAA